MITLQKFANGQPATPGVFNAPLYMADTNFTELEVAQADLAARIDALEEQQGGGGGGNWTWVDTVVNLDGSDVSEIYEGTCPTVNMSIDTATLYPDAIEVMVSIISQQYVEYSGPFQSYIWVNNRKMGLGSFYLTSVFGHFLHGVFVAPANFLFRGKFAFPNTIMSVLAWR